MVSHFKACTLSWIYHARLFGKALIWTIGPFPNIWLICHIDLAELWNLCIDILKCYWKIDFFPTESFDANETDYWKDWELHMHTFSCITPRRWLNVKLHSIHQILICLSDLSRWWYQFDDDDDTNCSFLSDTGNEKAHFDDDDDGTNCNLSNLELANFSLKWPGLSSSRPKMIWRPLVGTCYLWPS